MKHDQLEGNWKQFKGALLEKWGKLTNNDLDIAQGHREIIAGKLQEHYGISLARAKADIDEFYAHYMAEQGKSPEIATEGAPVDSETLKIGM